MVNLFCYKVTKKMRIIHIFCNSLRRFTNSCVYINMNTTKTIILFFFLSLSLQAQWQKTDYGFVSADSTFGLIKYDTDFEKLTIESNKSMSVFDLSEGKIINQKTIDNVFDSLTVTTYDLKYQYQVLTKLKDPGIHNGEGIQVIKIFKKEDNKIIETIIDTLRYEYEGHGLRGAVSINYKLVEDSLLVISMDMIEYWDGERESDLTYIYNLESRTYYKIDGIFSSYNDYSSKSNIYYLRDYRTFRDFNPEIYKTTLYYRFYKKGTGVVKYYNRQDIDLRNIALPNYSNKFAVFSDEGYFIESFDSDDRIEHDTKEYLEMDAKLSEFDDFIIFHEYKDGINSFHIANYEANKILETFEIDYQQKLNFIKHEGKYFYCRGSDGRILKVYSPFFDENKLESRFFTEKESYFTEDEINFQDYSLGLPIHWKWDFGDGTTSNEQNPTKVYKEAGEYTVSLIVENDLGLKDTLTKESYIKIIPKLESLFTYEILSENPLEVKFNNVSTGSPVKYIWNFGDGNITNEENPAHKYGVGIYDISLTAFDKYGNYDQKILLKEFDASIDDPINLPDFDFSTFTQLQLPTTSNLTDVEFFNENIGMIVSENGEIFTTHDGGISWIKSDFTKEFTPNRLRFLSNGDAIIVGDKGTQIKSFDFGNTWVENTKLDTNRNIVDFDCKSPFECQLLTDINKIFSTNSKLEIDSDHEFKATFTPSFYLSKTTTEALKSIMANGDSYVVGTGAIYVDKINTIERYFHTLMKTTSFDSYEFMIYSELMTDKKGVITELEKLDSINVLYSLNNDILYYFYTNSSYPPYEILKTTATFDKFYASLNQIVIPLKDGNLVYMDSLVYDRNGFNSRTTTIKLDDSPLHDYHQITPAKGIAIGESGKYYITDFTTGIETQTHTPEIEVYPNPTTDVVKIHFSNMIQVESLEIYGITGNLVERNSYSDYTNNIIQKTDKLTTGVYFIKIITSNGVFHKKIIKF